MTAQEIALLPRGTAFVLQGCEIYNPIISRTNEIAHILVTSTHGVVWNIAEFGGYRLPNETEIRKFEATE